LRRLKVACVCGCTRWELDPDNKEHTCRKCTKPISTNEMAKQVAMQLDQVEEVA